MILLFIFLTDLFYLLLINYFRVFKVIHNAQQQLQQAYFGLVPPFRIALYITSTPPNSNLIKL